MSQTCVSLIRLKGRYERIEKFKDEVRALNKNDFGYTEVFSMNRIVPMPEDIRLVAGCGMVERIEQPPFREQKKIVLAPSDLQAIDQEDFDEMIQALKNIRKYGQASWCDWSLNHWGTKWEAFQTSYHQEVKDTIKIHTHGSAPYPVFLAMSRQHPKLRMDIRIATNLKSAPMFLSYANGEVSTMRVFRQHSEESLRFTCDVLDKDFHAEVRAMRDDILRYGAPAPRFAEAMH
jgi:hypothetical protein